MTYFSTQIEQLRSGNFRAIGNTTGSMGLFFGVIGMILNFIFFGIGAAIVGLIIISITLMVEYPLLKNFCPGTCGKLADFLKNNILRAFWYIVCGIIFFAILGISSVVGYVFYVIAGIFDILAGIFYIVAQLKGQNQNTQAGIV
eukprot:NODE_53_length_26956_cov_0.387348.p15 type:complete len:144 gc:universal NODE_53_length_26956_cov_0.387348:8640-9071(+)